MSTTETKRTPAISVDTLGDTLVFTFSNGEELRLNPSVIDELTDCTAYLATVDVAWAASCSNC